MTKPMFRQWLFKQRDRRDQVGVLSRAVKHHVRAKDLKTYEQISSFLVLLQDTVEVAVKSLKPAQEEYEQCG